jgi:hypothetical protein
MANQVPGFILSIVPACAQDCLVQSLKQEYLLRCNLEDLPCLCSRYGSNGYTVGELGHICSSRCSDRPPAFGICNDMSNPVTPVKRSGTTSPSPPWNAPYSSNSTLPASNSTSPSPSMSTLAPFATEVESNQTASRGPLSTGQLVTISIAGFAFVVAALFAVIMVYRRKRRKSVDIEAPKEYPALRASENFQPGPEPESRTDFPTKSKNKFLGISSKLRTWSKPRSLRSTANHDTGSTSNSSNCPSRGQISAHQNESALAIVQSKFGQLRTAPDEDAQIPESAGQAYPSYVGNSLMLAPAGVELVEQQQSPQLHKESLGSYGVESLGPWTDQKAKPSPEIVIRPRPELSIPPAEVQAMQNLRDDRLSLYFGYPFPGYTASPASPNRASPNLASTSNNVDANVSYIDDDTSTSIDTTLSDDETREQGQEPEQRVPTPIRVGFPPGASSEERIASTPVLTRGGSAAPAPALSPRLGAYAQPGSLVVQPQLLSSAPRGEELTPGPVNADASEGTVAKQPTMPNWDYHFF